MAGFYTAEYAWKNPPDFGWEVDRWLQSAAVEAGILGFFMYRDGQQFLGGDGIVIKGVENTIANVGRLGRLGMKETDRKIIRMMLGADKEDE